MQVGSQDEHDNYRLKFPITSYVPFTFIFHTDNTRVLECKILFKSIENFYGEKNLSLADKILC